MFVVKNKDIFTISMSFGVLPYPIPNYHCMFLAEQFANI